MLPLSGEKVWFTGITLRRRDKNRKKKIFKKKPNNIVLYYSIPVKVVTDREGASYTMEPFSTVKIPISW